MKKVFFFLLIVCSIVVVFFYLQFGNQSTASLQTNQAQSEHLSPTAFQSALQTEKYVLLDIRTLEEYNAGHIKGAIQSDFYQTDVFTQYLESLDKNQSYLIYCRSGKRSAKALAMMKNMGFTKVANLNGGINAWITANLPVEK